MWTVFKEGIPPKISAVTGAVNAHPAAPLLVSHLRDLGHSLHCPATQLYSCRCFVHGSQQREASHPIETSDY